MTQLIRSRPTPGVAARRKTRGLHPAPLVLAWLALLCSAVQAGQPYGYRVLDQKPQARDAFVQGLEIADGKLYVSSGGYGKSRLLRLDFASGQLEAERKLNPGLFAEGITMLGDRLYQLTWRARLLLVYSPDKLELLAQLRIPGEGWGMTNNGEQIIYGDGSDRLYFLSPSERRIDRLLNVTENGAPLVRLNELEWIDGRIWANIWQTDRIVIINPQTGAVEDSINLQGLLPVMERQPDTGVLNGIARDPADGAVWVTGKNWPWQYRIELVARPGPIPEAAAEAGESR